MPKYMLFGREIGNAPNVNGVHTGKTISKIKNILHNADILGNKYKAVDIDEIKNDVEGISQSLTVNKIDLLIDDNKSCKFNCDGYKYLLICAANDSKIINVDLLKLIGSINLGFIRYSSESYIGACSINIKPTYITLHGFYNKGYSYSTYQVYGIK